MNGIKLNFINSSNDKNNSSIVIFQKNVATGFDEIAVAWKVIKNCTTGSHHKLEFPLDLQLSAADAWGNELITPVDVGNGNKYQIYKDLSGNQLRYVGPGSRTKEVQLKNSLNEGSIDARIFRDGKLLALKTGVSPDQKAVFEFKPSIWIGVASQIEEGDIIDSANIPDVNTEINLLGIKAADIVMKGGGTGEKATKFEFVLENVIYG